MLHSLVPIFCNLFAHLAPLIGSCRLTICIMNCLALMMVYLIRANISLSMVCMVMKRLHSNSSTTADNTSWSAYGAYDNRTQYNWTDPNAGIYDDYTTPSFEAFTSLYQGEFEWSRPFQGHVLSSYFYGYLSTIFLGGWLAGRFGAKHVISVGLFVSATVTLLIPAAARLNDYLIIVLRVIIGATSAMFYSAMMSLGGLWYTPHDRSILTAISVSGASIGSMLAYGISGLFCSLPYVDNGWPLAFYVTELCTTPWLELLASLCRGIVFTREYTNMVVDNRSKFRKGGAQLLLCVPWVLLVYSSPDQHPRISHREREYIATCSAIKTSIAQGRSNRVKSPLMRTRSERSSDVIEFTKKRLIGVWVTSRRRSSRSPFPWLKAFTSPAVIAVVCAMVAHTWYMYMTMTSIPLYFQDVLHFPIKQNGMWLILPHVVTLATTTPLGILADSLIRRHILSTMVVRKLYQTTATIGCCAVLITVSFMDHEQRYIATGLLTAGNLFLSMVRSGYLVNTIDIAPRYSGEISGISNTFATLSGILAPVAVGYITTNGTRQEWQNVFYISAAVMFAGGLVFFVFAKGTVLPWARDNADLKSQLDAEDTTMKELVVERTENDGSLDDSTTYKEQTQSKQ